MAKLFSALIILNLIVSACSKTSNKQFEYSGGTITMALDNQPSTYIARDVSDYYSATVLNQICEGLVGIDPKTTKILPKIASEWKRGNDGKSYTFTIRDDVFFHEHAVFESKEERKLTPEDVVKTFELGCTLNSDGIAPSLFSMVCKDLIKGANEFMSKSANSISGIVVKDNKVTFELVYEDHNFLYKLANVNADIVSKKIVESGYETDVIGTGPFVYNKFKDGEIPKLILTKNQDYYIQDEEGNALPYMDSVVFLFQSRKLAQLDLFEEGQTDFIIGLPTSRITRMLEGRIEDFNSKPPKLVLANNALLESNFYFFNMLDERFKDPRVRMAFNYAIDKEVIGREILRNQYYDLGDYGITPPVGRALKGYDFKSIKKQGYSFNPEKAKKLLAEAGYPGGKGFGSVQLRFNINDTHSAVADEFSKQIFQVLGINVNIDGSTFEQLIQDQQNGNGDIFRLGWSADYPSPESFLANFYGKSIPDDINAPSMVNKGRYKNLLFDQFFEKAIDAQKISDQMLYFAKAEAELLKNPAIVPLWYTGDIEISNSYVRNLHFNALNYIDFTRVYLKEWTEDEYQAKLQENKNN